MRSAKNLASIQGREYVSKKIKKIEISEDSDPIAIKVYCYEELSDTSKEAFIKAFGVVYAKELWGANIDCHVEFIGDIAIYESPFLPKGSYVIGFDPAKDSDIKSIAIDYNVEQNGEIITDGNYRERNFEAYED